MGDNLTTTRHKIYAQVAATNNMRSEKPNVENSEILIHILNKMNEQSETNKMIFDTLKKAGE